MIHTAAVVIPRPIDEVFRFAANLANIPLWVRGAQIKPLSTSPLGDGTRFAETLMRFGRAVISIVEVTNYQVKDGFAFQTLTALLPFRSTIGGLHVIATAGGKTGREPKSAMIRGPRTIRAIPEPWCAPSWREAHAR